MLRQAGLRAPWTARSLCCSQLPLLQRQRHLSAAPAEATKQHHHRQQHQQLDQQTRNGLSQVINFTDTAFAYKCFSTPELLRAWLVLRVCGFRPLVANAERILKLSHKVPVWRSIVDTVIKYTFFQHFCAGETAEQVGVRVRRLQRLGVNGIFDYAAESDVVDDAHAQHAAAAGGPAPVQAAAAHVDHTVVARQFAYESEAACDAHAAVFVDCIRAVRDQSPGGFAAVKLTALGDPLLLRRASACIVELRNLFHRLDEGATGRITPAQFAQGYSRLFRMETPQERAHFEALVKQLGGGGVHGKDDECIDYVSWSNRIEIEDLSRISSACREDGPFSRAARALDAQGLALLRSMRQRVAALAAEARSCNVRLMIDAEQTLTQPIIDNLVSVLQRQYNTASDARPTIYGTYQCYLKDAPQRLSDDLERARRGGYAFACKLVRGAYMETERARAAVAGSPSPVCDTIEGTHAHYARATDLVLRHMADGHRAEVMFATHNQGSVEYAVKKMTEYGLSPGDGVSFGQLLGMSDHLSFPLGACGYHVYKYCPYGKVAEVIPYLLRRAQENSGLMSGAAHERSLLLKEVQRRLVRS